MSDPTQGRKYDTGKPEYGLIPPHSLEEMVKVLTLGAQKYDRENWRYVNDGNRRYFDAAQRHLWAWRRGEDLDPESGLSHIGHAMANLFFLYEIVNGHTYSSNTNFKKNETV